eukprot:sb/3474846/
MPYLAVVESNMIYTYGKTLCVLNKLCCCGHDLHRIDFKTLYFCNTRFAAKTIPNVPSASSRSCQVQYHEHLGRNFSLLHMLGMFQFFFSCSLLIPGSAYNYITNMILTIDALNVGSIASYIRCATSISLTSM